MYLECGQGEKCVLQSVDSKEYSCLLRRPWSKAEQGEHQPRPRASGEGAAMAPDTECAKLHLHSEDCFHF